MTEEVRLVGLSGEYGGKSFPLQEGETTIGRGEECTLQIIDSRISRMHALLRSDGDDWVLEDLESTHGTFVKGQKIEKVVLQHGDTITIGETILRFESTAPQDAIPTEMASLDEVATLLETPDAIPTEMASPDDIATVMATADDIPTQLASPDELAKGQEKSDAISADLPAPDDIPTQIVSPDDLVTVMSAEAGVEAIDAICRQCGMALVPDERFCGECGTPRTDVSAVEAPPGPPTKKDGEDSGTPLHVPPPAVKAPTAPAEKRKLPWKWIGIIGGLVTALIIVGAGLVLMRGLFTDQADGNLAEPAAEENGPILTLEAQATNRSAATAQIPANLAHATPDVQVTMDVTVQPAMETQESSAEASPDPVGSGITMGGAAQIAFASNRTGRPQIYLFDLETFEEKQLTDIAGGACQPSWSSDGSRLAYTSPCNTNREEYNGSSIFWLEVDSEGNPGALNQLITTVGGGDYDPAWIRDGTRIAFTSWRTGRPQIFTVNFDGSDLRNLNDDLAYNWAPTWSSDGTQLAFLTGRGGQEEIWTVPAAGGEERRFSRSDGKDVARPDWAPDGTVIVFEKIVGNIPRLIAAPVVDGGVRELQICQEGQLSLQPMGEPTWSPDGTWLAFETWPDGVNHEIAVMRASCTEYNQLTTDAGLDFDAAWRPMSQSN